jgi:hypothetical protein
MEYLVGGIPTPLKNMKVNGKDDIPYMKWKIKAMFETTNQVISHDIPHDIYHFLGQILRCSSAKEPDHVVVKGIFILTANLREPLAPGVRDGPGIFPDLMGDFVLCCCFPY